MLLTMKMAPERRAIDKIYKRRDRYDIPDWQREKVWKRPGKIKSKRKRLSAAFALYGGIGTPETMEPALLAVVQANLLGAVEGDLKAILRTTWRTRNSQRLKR